MSHTERDIHFLRESFRLAIDAGKQGIHPFAAILVDADGNVLAEVTIGSGTSERWVKASGDDVIYRLASFRIDRITPTRERMEPSS